jgi:predicted metal-binding membrane protein
MAEAAADRLVPLLRRDRLICGALLAAVCALAWVYTLAGAGIAPPAGGLAPAPDESPGSTAMGWSLSHGALMLAMWWVMMVAMMLPSAAPVILLAAALNRRTTGRAPFSATAVFVAGYLLAWLGFSLAAVAAQAALSEARWLGSGMASASGVLSGGLLLAAGAWQFTPAKRACLRHCRSPVDWLIRHRGRGWRGALAIGVGHGGYCLGCCWALMALLFAGGVMDPLWIAGLALLVLVEKLAPRGPALGRITGLLLLMSGGVVLLP